VFILCYLGKHNPLKQSSSFQVASLSDEHSLLKSFSEFQKRGKERLERFLIQPLIFRKNTTFETILFVPSCKFIGRTFAFKKFYGVFKRGKERLVNLSYLGKTQPLKQSSFQVASLSDEHSLLKSFTEFSKGVKRGYTDS